jgi:hypothetical protein
MKNFSQTYPFHRAAALITIAAFSCGGAIVLGIVCLTSFRSVPQYLPAQYQGVVADPGMALNAVVPPDSRVITVTGTADMLVPPDEISVDILYREYWNSSKKKMSIDRIEKKIVQAAAAAGVSRKNVTVDAYNAWNHNWNYWNRWYERHNHLAQKRLTVKVSSASQLNALDAERSDHQHRSQRFQQHEYPGVSKNREGTRHAGGAREGRLSAGLGKRQTWSP